MNNIANKLVNSEALNDIINQHLKQKIQVKNVKIYQKAFIHKSCLNVDSYEDSYDKDCMFKIEMESNERLEFIGDSILNMATALYIFGIFPDKDEGFMTKLRTKLVRNTQLSHIGTLLGFKEYLLISCHIERIHGRDNPRLIEDVFESFIASLYLDQGFEVAREFIFTCFDKYVDLNEILSVNDNYKDILLRFYQLNNWLHPAYKLVVNNGNKEFISVGIIQKKDIEVDRYYDSIISIDKKLREKYNLDYENCYVIGEGIGNTKKISEQDTSKNILEYLGVPNTF